MNRKDFLKKGLLSSAALAMTPTIGCATKSKENVKENAGNDVQSKFAKTLEVPQRLTGQTTAVGLTNTPMDKVRVAFIGLGARGSGAVYRYTQIEDAVIVALCDLVPEKVKRSQSVLTKNNRPEAVEYSGEEGWKDMIKRDDIDLVYICTPWLLHTPQSVAAMKAGKHVACEVPSAMSIKECWELVDTCEQTRKHFMMLENCCYDFFEMNTLNMAQQGVFGDIIHCEGAYIHDLRSYNFDPNGYQGMWRLKYNAAHDGNPYPTHGLGPIAQIMNINRGDRMAFMTSMSTRQIGMTEYAKEKLGADSPEAKMEIKKGDMNNTLIKTVKGNTLLIQHDVTSPRPYDRIHKVSGTKGYCQKYPIEGIAIEPNAHSFLDDEAKKELLAKYEHPLIKSIREQAERVGGHGGMDFIMDYRLIYCMKRGLPLDESVYDAATWCSLVELSELSCLAGSEPIAVPDFTRGEWEKTPKFEIKF